MTAASTSAPTTTAQPIALPSHHFRRLGRWLLLAAMVGTLALVVWRVATMHRAAPVRYETARVDQGPLAAKVTATGTLSALVTVTVGSQVSGRIDTLGADFESQVHKGQVIATIEPSLFHAAVAQARANYFAAIAAVNKGEANESLAIKQVDRAEALNKEGLLSRADLDTARATRESSHADVDAARSSVGQFKAALDQAELNLKYTVIISPIDGVVISRNVDIGQTVAATFQAPTLFIIAQDLTRMQVDTNVAEADVGKVRADMPVTFTVDAYPDRKFGGIVRQVRDNAQTIQNVVTYDAVIDVDNTARLLKPGMTASVTFVYSQKSNVVRVPASALRFKPEPAVVALMGVTPPVPKPPDEHVVWLLRDGKPVPVLATVGISDGQQAEVVKGDVHPDDAIVVEATEVKK